MDLPLWDSSGDQVAYESGYCTEDYLLRHFSFGYERDMLEEDALNAKSCIQVLKLWIDKADEDIVKLEDDLLMLQSALAWADEDWSKQCSAALREKIDHLDILIQSLKDDREDGLPLETEELPPRLHDLLKPLLENYLAKRKQTETSIIQMPVPPAVELSNKKSEASTSSDSRKIEENVCTIMIKTYERKSKSTELEERKINHPLQKKDAVTTGFNASAHTCPNNEVSENFRSRPSTPEGKRMPNLVHVKSEPADPMVKESSASTSIERADSRVKEEKRNNNNNAISKANVIQDRILHEIKVTNSHLKLQETGSQISETVEVVDSMKQRTEGSSKVRKARVYRRVINKNAISVQPWVKMKEKNTKFPETPEAVEALKTEMKNSPCSLNDRTEHVKKPRMELEPQIQRRGIATLVFNQATSISPLKPEGRGPQKKCKEIPEIHQNSILADQLDKGPSSTKNLMGQKKNGVVAGMSKKGEKETQQQLNENNIAGTSEGTATPILLPQEVRKLSFSSQTTSEKEGLKSSVMKLETTEATFGVKNVPEISSLFIKDKEKLTLSDLRVIAKSKKLRCYSKLRKEELRKLLGFVVTEKKQGISPANTV